MEPVGFLILGMGGGVIFFLTSQISRDPVHEFFLNKFLAKIINTFITKSTICAAL